MATHYSNVQQMEILTERASQWARHIIEQSKTTVLGKQKHYPVLVYTGMSGIGSATALAMKLRELDPSFLFGMVYVRKPNEKSHGSRVEYNLDNWDGEIKRKYWFVDDFVCGGNTFGRAMTAVAKTSIFDDISNHASNFKAKKVGVVEMNNTPEHSIGKRTNKQWCFDEKLTEAFRNIVNGHDDEY